MGFFDTLKAKAGALASDAERAGKVTAAQARLVVLQNDLRKAEREFGHGAFALIERGELDHPELTAPPPLGSARSSPRSAARKPRSPRSAGHGGAPGAAGGAGGSARDGWTHAGGARARRPPTSRGRPSRSCRPPTSQAPRRPAPGARRRTRPSGARASPRRRRHPRRRPRRPAAPSRRRADSRLWQPPPFMPLEPSRRREAGREEAGGEAGRGEAGGQDRAPTRADDSA